MPGFDDLDAPRYRLRPLSACPVLLSDGPVARASGVRCGYARQRVHDRERGITPFIQRVRCSGLPRETGARAQRRTDKVLFRRSGFR